VRGDKGRIINYCFLSKNIGAGGISGGIIVILSDQLIVDGDLGVDGGYGTVGSAGGSGKFFFLFFLSYFFPSLFLFFLFVSSFFVLAIP
jgi:hypothetical protein